MTDLVSDRLSPGDIVAIETGAGTAHVQITHLRAPYPDVLRAIRPNGASAPDEIAKGETAFVAMVELARALKKQSASVRVIGHATIPKADRAFPVFRMPIRNKAGEIVYWWTWDGDGLSVSPEAGDTDLPIREIMTVSALCERLALLF
ncbi:hypothetical protein [Ovoidimarina sediminis]|uniref:hypothetical protein n=1 Tax=Ovoidimarina sediminis TaxID=3079856 RepID=UPI00290DC7EC|nr:hypothetical protein [Rhodophyticola sp. MJ-SS7]MDU8945719.1 hypothetical protein [Rhodophyticola sp. MJ-SS7]